MSVALLSCVLLFGASTAPLAYLLLEALGVALLILALAAKPGCERAAGDTGFHVVLLLLVGLFLLQLLPLPYTFWEQLPGHRLPADILEAASLSGDPRASSLDADATLAALLYLIPGIGMFLATRRATMQQRIMLCTLVVCFALLSVMMGAAQVGGIGPAYLYPTSHEGYAVGFFLNRNHEAVFLLVGIALLPILHLRLKNVRVAGTPRLAMTLAVFTLLAVGEIITTSRAGLVLMPIAILSSLVIALPSARRASSVSRPEPSFGRRPIVWIACIALIIVILLLLSTSGVVRGTVGRLDGSLQDIRTIYWRDTLIAIRAYWPIGTGFGTFVPIYGSVEALDSVGTTYVNHAHNDYLEIALEGGLPAVLLILVYCALLVRTMFRQCAPDHVLFKRCALLAIILLLLHSAVDYPMRTYLLLTIFGFLNGMLLEPRPAGATASLRIGWWGVLFHMPFH